jgi:choline dehydrogenase-like flavoprotein
MLTCGSFNSPHLLMLSGIGPARELASHGIKPVVDLKGIGQNLQDHIAVVVSVRRPIPGPFRHEMRLDRMPVNMLRAYLFGKGPATYLPGGLHGFVKTDSSRDTPDIQLLFRGVPGRPHLWFPGLRKAYEDQCGVRPVLLHPESRGKLSLRSADPFDKIRIAANSLQTEADMRTLRTGVALSRDIFAQAPLKSFRGSEMAPGPKASDGRALDDWIRRTAVAVHHPCGTCAMGTGADAVLDDQLRVRGIENLRIADASAMPDLVSGNINACVLMIAETASDLLLGKDRLLPAALPELDQSRAAQT